MSPHPMRVYVPITRADLAALHRDGRLRADTGFALTDQYRAAAGADVVDDELLEYDLLMAAATASLQRPRADDEAGRAVLAVDVPAQPEMSDATSGRVAIDGPIMVRDVAAVHVDDTTDDGVDGDDDLSWYAPQEIVDLL